MYHEDVKPKILAGFINRFNKDGARVNLDDVCADIHVSKKTIYRFFRSKQAIYEAILFDARESVLASQREIFEDNSSGPAEKLRRILTISTQWDSRVDVSKIFELKEAEPAVYAEIVEAFSTQWDYVERIINLAREQDLLKENISNAYLISLLQAGMLMFYQGDTLAKMGMSYPEALNLLADTVLAGCLK